MAEEVKKQEGESEEPQRKPGALDIIIMKPMSPVLAQIVKDKLVEEHNVVYATSTPEAMQLTYEYERTLIYACIVNKKNVESICQLLLKLKIKIKMRQTKVVILTKVINPQLRTMIAKLGITDYVEEPINARSLMFKVNMQLKALKTQIDKEKKAEEDSKKQVVFKGGDGKKKEEDGVSIEFKKKPALEVGQDAFVFSGQPPQKKDNKYTVVYDGPSPIDGEWKKDTEDKSATTPKWKWTPNNPALKKNPKNPNEEAEEVVFEGDKPQFNPGTGQWQFKGEKPELTLQLKKKPIGKKISTNEKGELEIAEEKPESVQTAIALRKQNVTTKKKDINIKLSSEKKETGEEESEDGSEVETAEADSSEEGTGLKLKKAGLKEKSAGVNVHDSKAPETEAAEDGEEKIKLKGSGLKEKEAAFNNKAGKAEAISDKEIGFKSLENQESSPEDEEEGLQLKKNGKGANGKSSQDVDEKSEGGEEDDTDSAEENLKLNNGARKKPKDPTLKTTEGEEDSEDEEQIKLKGGLKAKEKAAQAKKPGSVDGEEDLPEEDQIKLKRQEAKKAQREKELKEEEGKTPEEVEQIRLKRAEERKKKNIERGKEILNQVKELAKKPIKEDLSPEEVEAIEDELKLPKGKHKPAELARKKRKKEIEELQKAYLDEVNANREEDATPETKVHELGPERADYINADLNGEADRARSKMNAYDSVEKAPEDGKDVTLDKLDGAYGKKIDKPAGESGNEESEDLSPELKGRAREEDEESTGKKGKKEKSAIAEEIAAKKQKVDESKNGFLSIGVDLSKGAKKDTNIKGEKEGENDKSITQKVGKDENKDFEAEKSKSEGIDDYTDKDGKKKFAKDYKDEGREDESFEAKEERDNDLGGEDNVVSIKRKDKTESKENGKESKSELSEAEDFSAKKKDKEQDRDAKGEDIYAAKDAKEGKSAASLDGTNDSKKSDGTGKDGTQDTAAKKEDASADPASGEMIRKKATEEQEKAREALNERLAKRMKSLNPELANFLENRKKSDVLVTPDAKIAKKVEDRFEKVTNPENALLGFKMSLSDAVHLTRTKNPLEKTVKKVLQQGVVGIGFCTLTLIKPVDDTNGIVFSCSDTSVHESGTNLNLIELKAKHGKELLFEALTGRDGKAIIGYLYVAAIHKRNGFDETEANTLKRMVELFAPYWESASQGESSGEMRKTG